MHKKLLPRRLDVAETHSVASVRQRSGPRKIADVAGGRGDISNRPVAALGAKASGFETRKLAAILAVDIVGFSRLTGADEDRTLASQPRC